MLAFAVFISVCGGSCEVSAQQAAITQSRPQTPESKSQTSNLETASSEISEFKSPNPGDGQQLMRAAAQRTAQHVTIESQLRVRTDLMGQPLVGSGEYAQLRSSAGLLLRMELAIQAGEQATSVKQISDGRDLWEHWRMAGAERVNHIDLRRVEQALQQAPAGTAAVSTSANLATGGLPKLLLQLVANFEFDKAELRSGKVGEVPVWFVVGVWKPERLAAAAPQAVDGDTISFQKLPVHLPHQVEVLLGRNDLFPYRITYQRWHAQDGKHVLRPAVTTEFFEVAIDQPLDPTQFNYQKPSNLSVTDRTDAFIQSLGIPPNRGVAKKPRDRQAR